MAISILLCCEYYTPSVGGVQEVMRQIAERLVSFGFCVTVVTSVDSRRPRYCVINGVSVYSFDVAGNSVRGLRGEVGDYQSHLLKGDYDSILINAAQQWTFDASVDVLARLNSRLFFIPCGFSSLGKASYRHYYQQMPRWLDLFDGLIFATEYYQDYIFAAKYSQTRRVIIPNGVDEREFQGNCSDDIRELLSIPVAADLLLSVGSLLRSKGHWETLHAYAKAELTSPSVLVINGNAPHQSVWLLFLKTIINSFRCRFPLSLHLWFLGSSLKRQSKRVIIVDLPRRQVVSLFKEADLFVFPSHVEYSPLVLFEAAASGTPFVASQAGNSSEIATQTGAGCTLRPVSSESSRVCISELASTISTLMQNRKVLTGMSRQGREAIVTRQLCWADLAKRYAALLTNEC